jgi:electron transfer flavoprotein alpha subunit
VILVLVEHDGGAVAETSLEALTVARGLAGAPQTSVDAVAVGDVSPPMAESLRTHGVETLHSIVDRRLERFAPDAWAAGLAQVIEELQPDMALAAGTDRGNEVMARVAARLDLPMAANCTEVHPGDTFVVTRLRWGGSLLEDAELHRTPKLLTIAPHAMRAQPAGVPSELALTEATPAVREDDLRVQVAREVAPSGGKVSLAEAKVVIGGGRGVGSKEGFAALEELAGLLGGAVGCSRVVTSVGWRPHSDQVGQTGVRIAPDLYIACGISGAIQHMVGCKAAKTILAINTDAEAPIVTKAAYAVIGDLRQIIPAINAELRKELQD